MQHEHLVSPDFKEEGRDGDGGPAAILPFAMVP